MTASPRGGAVCSKLTRSLPSAYRSRLGAETAAIAPGASAGTALPALVHMPSPRPEVARTRKWYSRPVCSSGTVVVVALASLTKYAT